MQSDEPIKPEAMTMKQLAASYNVCVRTMKKWLKPFLADIGERKGTYLFTPAQIETIYNKIGTP